MSQKSNVPKLGEWLIRLLIPSPKSDLIIGDFEEYMIAKRKEGGRHILLMFWIQLLLSIPSLIRQSIIHWSQLSIYSLKMASRNLKKHLAQQSLNLGGLTIGMACFVVIMLYVNEERSFDRFHKNADRIYRVLDIRKVNGEGEESTSAPTPLVEAMFLDYPDQIESYVRFFNFQAPSMSLSYEKEGRRIHQYNESKIYFVDHHFFKLFDFQLLVGDESSALSEPNKIVISSSMAKKYFGEVDPMGKVLELEGKHYLIVSGVIEDCPRNSHIQYDFLVSFETLDNPAVLAEWLRQSWIWNPSWTYLLLNESTSPDELEARFPEFVQKHFPESRRDRVKLFLQPLVDIHLHSNLDYEMRVNGDELYVNIFTAVAFFILLISYINFINLTTARASIRKKEMGLRKILGSSKNQLVFYLLCDSLLINFLAIVLSIPISLMIIEGMDILLDFRIVDSLFPLPWSLWEIAGLFLTVSLISGIYPAIYLSSFNPIRAVSKGDIEEKRSVFSMRKLMVIGQLALTIVFISWTLIASSQLSFLKNRSVGFDSEKVILLPSLRSPIMAHYPTFKSQLLGTNGIESMTTVEDLPGIKHQTGSYRAFPDEAPIQVPRLIVHNDFAHSMGIPIVAGRDFSEVFEEDYSVIINRTLAKQIGYAPEEAIGKEFNEQKIVGVTEDFHFTSLRRPIGPFVIQKVGDTEGELAFSARYIAIRVNESGMMRSIESIEKLWRELAPQAPFEFFMLEDLLVEQYETENTIGSLSTVFSLLSILIAFLGLYGLSTFLTRRRIKEIGIRKVLGASISSLLVLLSNYFIGLVLIAVIIAIPVAYWIMSNWLEGFAYQISLSGFPFVLSSLIVSVLVLLTISFEVIKSALTNPVNTLRDE